MALNAPRAWLICYDITDPKRLGRLHRFIKKHAVPVQYSVYYHEGSTQQVMRLMRDIEGIIDPKTDDVRAYPIPDSPCIDQLGRGSLPDEVGLHSVRNTGLASMLQAQSGSARMNTRNGGTRTH